VKVIAKGLFYQKSFAIIDILVYYNHKDAMDLQTLALLTLFFSLLFFIYQRSQRSARRMILFLMVAPLLLLRHYAMSRGVETEAWVALFISIILNFLFWALIGRYNPVASKEVRVMGLDD
jgi:hypothetical protein